MTNENITLNGTAYLYDDSQIGGQVESVYSHDNAIITDTSIVTENAFLFDNSIFSGTAANINAQGNVTITNTATITGNAILKENVTAAGTILGNCTIGDQATFSGVVSGNVKLSDTAVFIGQFNGTSSQYIPSVRYKNLQNNNNFSQLDNWTDSSGVTVATDAVEELSNIFIEALAVGNGAGNPLFNRVTVNNTNLNMPVSAFDRVILNNSNIVQYNGAIYGDAYFYGSSENQRAVVGNAYFYDSSFNSGTVTKNAIFLDNSYNSNTGAVSGTLTLGGFGTYNSGIYQNIIDVRPSAKEWATGLYTPPSATDIVIGDRIYSTNNVNAQRVLTDFINNGTATYFLSSVATQLGNVTVYGLYKHLFTDGAGYVNSIVYQYPTSPAIYTSGNGSLYTDINLQSGVEEDSSYSHGPLLLFPYVTETFIISNGNPNRLYRNWAGIYTSIVDTLSGSSVYTDATLTTTLAEGQRFNQNNVLFEAQNGIATVIDTPKQWRNSPDIFTSGSAVNLLSAAVYYDNTLILSSVPNGTVFNVNNINYESVSGIALLAIAKRYENVAIHLYNNNPGVIPLTTIYTPLTANSLLNTKLYTNRNLTNLVPVSATLMPASYWDVNYLNYFIVAPYVVNDQNIAVVATSAVAVKKSSVFNNSVAKRDIVMFREWNGVENLYASYTGKKAYTNATLTNVLANTSIQLFNNGNHIYVTDSQGVMSKPEPYVVNFGLYTTDSLWLTSGCATAYTSLPMTQNNLLTAGSDRFFNTRGFIGGVLPITNYAWYGRTGSQVCLSGVKISYPGFVGERYNYASSEYIKTSIMPISTANAFNSNFVISGKELVSLPNYTGVATPVLSSRIYRAAHDRNYYKTFDTNILVKMRTWDNRPALFAPVSSVGIYDIAWVDDLGNLVTGIEQINLGPHFYHLSAGYVVDTLLEWVGYTNCNKQTAKTIYTLNSDTLSVGVMTYTNYDKTTPNASTTFTLANDTIITTDANGEITAVQTCGYY